MEIINEILEFIDMIGGLPYIYGILACIIFLVFCFKMLFDLNHDILSDEDIIRMGKNSEKSSKSENTSCRRTRSSLRQPRRLRRNRVRH